MNSLIFDIKTSTLPADELEKIKPRFTAPSNYRDVEKIATSVIVKETAWKERAALSALSGRVIAVGYLQPGVQLQIIDHDDETEILRSFWSLCRRHVFAENGNAIGFNIYNFDLPFLLRRSWRLNVPVPIELRQGRYWNHRFIDLLDIWMLQDNERVSLAHLCAYFELGEKPAAAVDFAHLWNSDRPKVRSHLEQEIKLIHRLAHIMGVLPEERCNERSLMDNLLEKPRREKPRFKLSLLAPLSHVTE